MLNIVIPMAGRGSRFASAGYKLPKPLIPVHEKPMIEVVVNNLRPKNLDHRFVFICQAEHVAEFDLRNLLGRIAPNSEIIALRGITEGAACTVLSAREIIETTDPLMIANSDQWIDLEIDSYLDKLESHALDGLIMTMTANDPKWSFVKLNEEALVTDVKEKEVISNEATVGIYNFRSGTDYCRAADAMIAANERVNNEFYVAPVYNRMIAEESRVGIYNIGAEGNGMYGLGIPGDLEAFLKLPISKRV